MTVGRERIKNWVQKILNTQKGRYKIYNGTGYGINIEDTFVGKNYNRDYIRSEVKREITEMLTANEDIVSRRLTAYSIFYRKQRVRRYK